jgi:hypothetical protein
VGKAPGNFRTVRTKSLPLVDPDSVRPKFGGWRSDDSTTRSDVYDGAVRMLESLPPSLANPATLKARLFKNLDSLRCKASPNPLCKCKGAEEPFPFVAFLNRD